MRHLTLLGLLVACSGDAPPPEAESGLAASSGQDLSGSGSPASAEGDRPFVLAYQNNVNGDVEPCG